MIKELDVDGWLDNLPKKLGTCLTCNNPDASHLLNKILDSIIEKRDDGSLKKLPSQLEIHAIVVKASGFSGSVDNIRKHLNGCIKTKWEAARYGRI